LRDLANIAVQPKPCKDQRPTTFSIVYDKFSGDLPIRLTESLSLEAEIEIIGVLGVHQRLFAVHVTLPDQL
jgi:hypothetical protein